MDKKLIYLLVIIFLFISSVHAIEVGGGELTEEDIADAQEQIRAYSELGQKIDDSTVKNKENMEKMAIYLTMQTQNLQQNMLIAMVLIVVAGIGLNFAIKLYFKSKKLL